MATISLDELAELRSIIGDQDPPSDAELDEDYRRLGSVDAVALEIQRSRLATLRAQPSSFTIEGDRQETWTETIRSLERHVATLEGKVDVTVGVLQVGQFTRASRTR